MYILQGDIKQKMSCSLNSLRQLLHHHLLFLSSITLIAIIVRAIPGWTNPAWGNDFGIYYGLTQQFIQNKSLVLSYDGWGATYEFFPMLYIITGIAHWISGIDVLVLLSRIAPIFGGLSVLIFYYIVHELTQKKSLALLSSVFLAVTPFHVYQTSHAAPLTIGHFFMMLCLLFFIKYQQQWKYVFLLLPCTLCLILSHHLTTYFFLITLVCILLVQSRKYAFHQLKKEFIYLGVSSAMTFTYWLLWAAPLADRMYRTLKPLQPVHIVGLFYLLIFCLFLFVYVMKYSRISWLNALKTLVFWRSEPHHIPRPLLYFCLSVIFVFTVEVVFLFVPFPLTGIRMTPLAIVYSLPIVLLIGISCMSVELIAKEKNHWFFQGWMLATIGSFIFSLITWNNTLFPDRHLEYIMVPVSFVGASGVLYLHQSGWKKQAMSWSSYIPHSMVKTGFIVFVVAVLFGNTVAVYSVVDSMEWSDEGIYDPTLNTIEWMTNEIDQNISVVATDLKLSKLLWANGFNVTYEHTNETWVCDQWKDCVNDLDSEEFHDRVTHVLIDDAMYEYSVNLALTKTVYMTNVSYEKFHHQPFELIYRNATYSSEGIELHWAEVYRVNWSHIQDYLPQQVLAECCGFFTK